MKGGIEPTQELGYLRREDDALDCVWEMEKGTKNKVKVPA